MTPDIYLRIATLITVQSRQPGINTLVASRDVLRAIPDVDTAQVDTYIEQRNQSLASGQTPLAFPAGAAFMSAAVGSVIDIHAEARMSDGAVFVREAVARRSGEERRSTRSRLFRGRKGAPRPQLRPNE